MARIENKVLYSWDESVPDVRFDGDESIVDVVLKGIRSELEDKGDRVVIVEAGSG